ncbi:MAG: helix-turn-helix transcriptional regulator [Pseudoxanthomonas sp.]
MTIGEFDMGNLLKKKANRRVSGESVRIIRAMQGLTQAQLAEECSISQSTIPGIGAGRVNLRVKRAKALATALRPHPAVVVFPGR